MPLWNVGVLSNIRWPLSQFTLEYYIVSLISFNALWSIKRSEFFIISIIDLKVFVMLSNALCL